MNAHLRSFRAPKYFAPLIILVLLYLPSQPAYGQSFTVLPSPEKPRNLRKSEAASYASTLGLLGSPQGHGPLLAATTLVSATSPPPGLLLTGGPGPGIQVFSDTVLSGGRKVRVERYEIPGSRKCPALILLHALDGMREPYADLYRAAARRFASRGYVILIVHFFDRTTRNSLNLTQLRGQFLEFVAGTYSPSGEKTIHACFQEWMEVVRDTIIFARNLNSVDSERLGPIPLNSRS